MTESLEHFDWDDVIDELQKPGGWCQGGFGANEATEGAVCLFGAIDRVAGLPQSITDGVQIDVLRRSGEIADFVGRLAKELFPERFLSAPCIAGVAWFNDHDDTTLADIILVCEKARAASGELQ